MVVKIKNVILVLFVVNLLTIKTTVAQKNPIGTPLANKYEINKSDNLEKKINICEDNFGWHYIHLLDKETETDVPVKLFTRKMKKTEQTRLYVQYVPEKETKISRFFVLLTLGNGKVYKSKPGRLITKTDSLNRKVFTTYYVFGKNIGNLIEENGIIEISVNFNKLNKGEVNANYELNKKEIEKLKCEIKWCVFSSYERILDISKIELQ